MSARSLPNDLIPLPTQPWNERPDSLPLDIQECRTAIWRAAGNVSKAADILKISSGRLRNFIRRSPYLSAEVQESLEQLADKAQDIIAEGLEDEDDKGRRDAAAKYVLDRIGKQRGWAPGNIGPSVNVKNAPGGNIKIVWADGTQFGDAPPANPMKTIDHE